MASVKAAKKLGARVISIVNVVGSQMERDSDDVIYTHAGPEIGVAATKTFMSQMTVMYPLAISIARACRLSRFSQPTPRASSAAVAKKGVARPKA